MKVTCDMCDGTGKYWVDETKTCLTCDGTGEVSAPTPTTEAKEFWLECNGRVGGSDGKWLLFVNKNNIDETWKKVRQDTVDENLGVGSKVSTKKGWIHHGMPENYVICIYTKDKTDRADVGRVRGRLKELGFIDKLGYKTNEATSKGIEELLYRE